MARRCHRHGANHGVAHLPRAGHAVARQRDVAGAQAVGQHLADRPFDALADLRVAEGVAKHHRHRQDRRKRIGLVLSGDVRGGTVDRLVESLAVGIQRRGRQHADRAGEHRRLVGQDVAEHVAGDDHVELLRIAHELHRRVVDVHVRELHVGIVLAHRADDFAPQDRRIEHVGLVHRAELAAALARDVEADARDAANFRLAVEHRVEAFGRSRGIGAPSARSCRNRYRR